MGAAPTGHADGRGAGGEEGREQGGRGRGDKEQEQGGGLQEQNALLPLNPESNHIHPRQLQSECQKRILDPTMPNQAPLTVSDGGGQRNAPGIAARAPRASGRTPSARG
eukprot:5537834-Pyramimonas_sp.AAC.1